MIGAGVYQFYKAYAAKFEEHLRQSQMSETARCWARRIGRAGLTARGVTFAVIGWFLVRAALDVDPSEARGLAGALRTLAPAGLRPLAARAWSRSASPPTGCSRWSRRATAASPDAGRGARRRQRDRTRGLRPSMRCRQRVSPTPRRPSSTATGLHRHVHLDAARDGQRRPAGEPQHAFAFRAQPHDPVPVARPQQDDVCARARPTRDRRRRARPRRTPSCPARSPPRPGSAARSARTATSRGRGRRRARSRRGRRAPPPGVRRRARARRAAPRRRGARPAGSRRRSAPTSPAAPSDQARMNRLGT